MNDELITINKRHLQDLEEKAALSRVNFALHSANAIKRVQENFDKQMQVLKAANEQLDQANIELSAANETLKFKNAELERQRNYMYKRLKERANADRALPNKKTFHGYVIESSRQTIEQYKDKYDISHANAVWKTSFQTPFEVALPFNIVQEAVIKDLGSIEMSNEFRFLYQPVDNFMDIAEDSSNILYRMQFICDRKHGYWCIDVWSMEYIAPSQELCR